MYRLALGALSLLGIVLPFWKFIPWVMDNGLNIKLFIQELFSTEIGAFFGLDVIVSAIVLVLFIFNDSKKNNVKNSWVAILCTCCVGVSFGFPVYLLLRELSFNRESK